jgi:hypothetical protein
MRGGEKESNYANINPIISNMWSRFLFFLSVPHIACALHCAQFLQGMMTGYGSVVGRSGSGGAEIVSSPVVEDVWQDA